MKLIALRCPNCADPLPVENDDVVVECHNCRTMVAVSQTGPVKMTVPFAVMNSQQSALKEWVPFWIFKGRVIIKSRETQGGSSEKDSKQMWQSPRALYVPAWEMSLQTAQNVGSRLIQQQPDLQQIERPENARFLPATVTPGDARKLLEFIVLAIEARRKDWLKKLEFDLDVGEPQMMALPHREFGSSS